MIMEMVTFDRPPGFSDNDLMNDARSVVDHWQANPHLIRKHFIASEDGKVSGVYIWPNRTVAKEAHNAAWVESFVARTGVTPTITYHDLFMVIDNQAGEVSEYPIGGG